MSNSPIPYLHAGSCQDVLKTSRSNFFVAFRFLSPEKRAALNRIYGFARVADDCVDEIRDAASQQAALDFWRGEIRKMYQSGQVLHPLVQDLLVAVRRFSIPEDLFLGLLEGCAMDVKKHRYENFSELHEYCYRVAGLVGMMCLKVFEYDSPTAKDFAINLGLAFQLSNILRDVKDDLKIGRIYFPRDEMSQFGVTENQLMAKRADANVLNYFKFFADRAELHYQKATGEFSKDQDQKLIAARVMMHSYHAILKKIRAKGFPVLEYRVSLNVFEKLGLMAKIFLDKTI